MGPKPVAGEDQIGFSPDDRKTEMNSIINTRTVKYTHTKSFFSSRMHCNFVYVLICFAGVGHRAVLFLLSNKKHTHTHRA